MWKLRPLIEFGRIQEKRFYWKKRIWCTFIAKKISTFQPCCPFKKYEIYYACTNVDLLFKKKPKKQEDADHLLDKQVNSEAAEEEDEDNKTSAEIALYNKKASEDMSRKEKA